MRPWMPSLIGLALLMTAQGCDYSPPPTDEEASAYAEDAPPRGEPVRFFFYTHCGVENARIGGRWWLAEQPLYGDDGEGSGPPDGWDNPQQEGRLVIESPKRAVFSANGTTVVLVPSANDEPVRICR